MTDKIDGLILLPRLRVENCNAISGPLTWGFPSPTAFTGFVHALQRNHGRSDIRIDGVGIVCHRFDPQVYKPSGKYQHYFSLARHPVKYDGETASIVEEGRAHMEVSLVIGVTGYMDEEDGAAFAKMLHHAAIGMRLAGGSLQPAPEGGRYKPEYFEMSGTLEGDEKIFRKLRRRLMPGFVLVDRAELLTEHLAELCKTNEGATLLDALLDISALHHEPEDVNGDDKTKWRTFRAKPGWLVPLPVGYGAISELYDPGTVRNSRDSQTPFRFVEALYSLGEWRSPHRFTHHSEILWYHRADPDTGIYIVKTTHKTPCKEI